MTKQTSRLGAILAITALLGAAIAGFNGCPLDPPTDAGSVGYGRVTIDLGDAVESVNHTVFPDKNQLTYTYTFTKDGGSPQTLTPSGGSFMLEYGAWSVRVNAYAGADQSSGNLAATGRQNFTVDAASQTVAVKLEGQAQGGTGTFKYKIQYPAGATVTSFTMRGVTGYPTVTLTPTPVTTSGMLEISETVNSVSAGFYLVTITVEKVGGSSGRNELVHIYNNLTTEFGTNTAPIVLTADNFTAIPLTEGVWTDGNLAVNWTQWFSFTAGASTQYIYFSSDSLYDVYFKLYDSADNMVGTEQSMSDVNFMSQTVIYGDTYYVQVRARYSSGVGTYGIAFSNSNTRPPVTFPTTGVTELMPNVYTDDVFPGVNDAGYIPGQFHWFRFTATATTHYIHVNLDSPLMMRVQLYSASGNMVGFETALGGSTLYSSHTGLSGIYYIRVRTNGSSSRIASYKIGFTSSATPPPVLLPTTGVSILTENDWTDGMFANGAYDEVKWFKFTASASSLFIHSKSDRYFGSARNVYIQLYDSNGIAVGGRNQQFNPIRVAVTSDNDYYIKTYTTFGFLSGYGDITHEITFSTNVIPPGVTPTSLAPDVWTNGDFPNWDQTHWYNFTATNATQYIHFSPGTRDQVAAQLYDSAGAPVGSVTFYVGNLYFSQSVTSGQTYYIKIDTSYSTSGT